MALMFKRNSISSTGGGGGYTGGRTAVGYTAGSKRPPEPTENEKILALKTETQVIKLGERKRQQEFKKKVEAAGKIQKAWRRYKSEKKFRQERKENEYHKVTSQIEKISKESVQKKRLKSTQEEWERQIAALTIQLAWRKFIRKKLLRSLHPNKRQLLMWDPEIVALKQHALVNYIYNEHIQAPFWHPTLKASTRPLWFRFIPSAAAVSYNFAVDQYVPWISRLGAQPPYPDFEPPPPATTQEDQPQQSPGKSSGESQSRSQFNSSRSGKSLANSNTAANKEGANVRKGPPSGSQRSSRFSYNMRKKS